MSEQQSTGESSPPALKLPEPLAHVEKDFSKYFFGKLERSAVNYLRLISELEGAYQMLKYMGLEEDMNLLDEIKTRYYKTYFKQAKLEKQ